MSHRRVRSVRLGRLLRQAKRGRAEGGPRRGVGVRVFRRGQVRHASRGAQDLDRRAHTKSRRRKRRRRIHGRMDEPGRVQGRGVGVRVRRDGRRVRCQRVAATLLPRARRRNYESNHARGGEVGGYWAAKRPRSLRVHLGDRHRERGGAASPRAGRARGGGDRLWSRYR